jgi:hypothetical protein
VLLTESIEIEISNYQYMEVLFVFQFLVQKLMVNYLIYLFSLTSDI